MTVSLGQLPEPVYRTTWRQALHHSALHDDHVLETYTAADSKTRIRCTGDGHHPCDFDTASLNQADADELRTMNPPPGWMRR